MKKFLKFIIPVGIFTLVMLAGGLVANAAKPEKPVYPTVQEVQQMIADAIAPLQTAINGLTARVTNVENSMPTPQPTPPMTFDIFLNETGITVSGQDVNLRFPVSTAQQRQISGAIWHEPIQRVQVWGILHTPDGDVASGVRYENVGANTEYCSLFFKMSNSYPGTSANVDIYAFYGGKVTSNTFLINL